MSVSTAIQPQSPPIKSQSLGTQQQSNNAKTEFDIDQIIESLLSVRGKKPGKTVTLSEGEIRWLCIKSREIFMSQPVLLELEAPIKIVGMSVVYYTVLYIITLLILIFSCSICVYTMSYR